MNAFLLVKSKVHIKVLLITLLIFVSCKAGPKDRNATTNARATEFTITRFLELAEVTRTPSLSITSTNTISSLPTEIAAFPSSTPTRVFITTTSPKPTPTFTPVATLSIEQEGTLLSSLMANNGGCELPCWWGITPGSTDVVEASDIFVLQGVDDWVESFDGTYALIGLGYPRVDSSTYSRDVIVQFGLENNQIQYIYIDGGYRQEELRTLFIQDWQSYSPASMLDRYGRPSYVEMAEIENSPYYGLTFSYQLMGTEASYIVPFEAFENNKRRICFDLEHTDFIFFVLYPSGQEATLPFSIIPDRLDTYIPWETTTGLDIEALYQLLEDTSNPPCFDLELKE